MTNRNTQKLHRKTYAIIIYLISLTYNDAASKAPRYYHTSLYFQFPAFCQLLITTLILPFRTDLITVHCTSLHSNELLQSTVHFTHKKYQTNNSIELNIPNNDVYEDKSQ